ncbi:hypothetical protein ACTM5Z_004362 [Salmonella enterica]
MSGLRWCLPVMALPAGYWLLHQADHFIREHAGTPLIPRQAAGLLWSCAAFLALYDLLAPDTGPGLLRVALLTGFLLPLCALDLACYWLPLTYCLSLATGGWLLTLLPGSALPPGTALTAAALMLATLAGIGWGLNRFYRWRIADPQAVCLGDGDVVLMSAMCLWLPLPGVALCGMAAWVVLLIHSAFLPAKPYLPLAPYLMLCTGVYLLL